MNEQRNKLYWTMRDWWKERLAEGCQLQFIDETQPRYDWIGDEPWKTRVAMDTLHRDFMASKNMYCTKGQFAQLWYKVTGIRNRVSKSIPMLTPNGHKAKKRIVFVRFGKQPLTQLP